MAGPPQMTSVAESIERRRARHREKYRREATGHKFVKVRLTVNEYEEVRQHALRFGHSIPEHLRTLIVWDLEGDIEMDECYGDRS